MTRILAIFALLAVAPATSALADGWHWFNPLGGQAGNDAITVGAGAPSSAIRISSSQSGDLQWYYIGLPGLPAGAEIDSVTVCYEVETPDSYISQVRITRMTTPDAQLVVFDDPTDLVSTDPECVSYAVPNPPEVAGAMTIAFRCDFASAGDWIEIGAIGIRLAMSPTPVSDDEIASRHGAR
ncbi:hypothetical protein GF314_08770, partial [bacterium]|nr:hypothetical protein [bacterium]